MNAFRKIAARLGIAAAVIAGVIGGVALPAQAWWQSTQPVPTLVPPGTYPAEVRGWVDYKGFNGGGRQLTAIAVAHTGDDPAFVCVYDTANGGTGVCITTKNNGTGIYYAYPLSGVSQIQSADAFMYYKVCNKGGSCTGRYTVWLDGDPSS